MRIISIVSPALLAVGFPLSAMSENFVTESEDLSSNNDNINTTSLIIGTSASSLCHANPYCQIYDGHCCPQLDGTFHDCCSSDIVLATTINIENQDNESSPVSNNFTAYYKNVHESASITRRRVNGPLWVAFRSKCIFNLQCLLLGLRGDCCPTAGSSGKYLDCCQIRPKACSRYPACSGLAGRCCPTTDGVYLACCTK